MKGCLDTEELMKLHQKITQRQKEERLDAATSDTLAHLNISIDALPQPCQELLLKCSTLQAALDIEKPDPVATWLKQSRLKLEKLEAEKELLNLKHDNIVLQKKIDRNNKVIEDLKRETQLSKDCLAKLDPNPANIEEHIRQTKQKVALYETLCKKAEAKYTALNVPDEVLPQSIKELAAQLASLKVEEESLCQRAEDITLARQTRDTLNRLRRK